MRRSMLALIIVAVLVAAIMLSMSCQSGLSLGKTAADKSDISRLADLQKPDGVDDNVWETLVNELDRSLKLTGADKRTAEAPTGASGKPVDLSAASGAGGAMTLIWRYRNTGDYDQNGEVGVPDITPIANNYLKDTTAPDWLDAIVIDGDDSGDIGVPDITPIANNYLNKVDGYVIETAISATDTFIPVEDSPWNDGHAPTGGPDPTKNWYDGSGDTAGFGIPDGLAGNLAAGQTSFETSCAGCHSGGKDNRTYQQFKDALANVPAMASLTLSDQEVADVTAYSNRDNTDPAPDVFDANGDTSGFGIPPMTSGNITAGDGLYAASCVSCHAVGSKDGRTYAEFDASLSIPAMSGITLTDQEKADVTAYLNRDNGVASGPVDAFLEFTHDVASPVVGDFYRVRVFEGTVPARTLGEPSDPVQYNG